MSLAPVTSKGHGDARGLVCLLRPCCCLRVMLQLCHADLEWPALPPEPLIMFGPKLLPRAMSGSMSLHQLGSVLMSMASVVTEGLEVPVTHCNEHLKVKLIEQKYIT